MEDLDSEVHIIRDKNAMEDLNLKVHLTRIKNDGGVKTTIKAFSRVIIETIVQKQGNIISNRLSCKGFEFY